MAVMMNPREGWTDERLDGLDAKVDQGFADLKAEMKEGFERMEARFSERFDGIDKRFDGIDKRLDGIDKRVARLEDAFFAAHRTLWGGGFVVIAALIGLIATRL